MDIAYIVHLLWSAIAGAVGASLVLARLWMRLRDIDYEVASGREQITRETRKRAAEARWEPRVPVEDIEALRKSVGSTASPQSTSDILRLVKQRKGG